MRDKTDHFFFKACNPNLFVVYVLAFFYLCEKFIVCAFIFDFGHYLISNKSNEIKIMGFRSLSSWATSV